LLLQEPPILERSSGLNSYAPEMGRRMRRFKRGGTRASSHLSASSSRGAVPLFVIASEAKQSRASETNLDCFVGCASSQ
jgi:hypothetical protein